MSSLDARPTRIRRPCSLLVPDPLVALVRVVRWPRRVRKRRRQTSLEILDAVQCVHQSLAIDGIAADLADRLHEHLRRYPIAFAEVVEGVHLVREVVLHSVEVLPDGGKA